MPRFTTVSFVTASVPASSSINHNEPLVGLPNVIDIFKVKIVPSIVGGTTEVQIYERDTFLTADLLWGTNPFTATGFDPIQKDAAGVITEALRGFIAPYEDKDSTGELHVKVINNDSQAKTYTIDVEYEDVTANGTFTQGSVIFADSGGLLDEDNANLFWDDTSNELGIGTATPTHSLEVRGTGALIRVAADQVSAFSLENAAAVVMVRFSTDASNPRLELGSGCDLEIFSDVFSTSKFRVDGPTGNVTMKGSLFAGGLDYVQMRLGGNFTSLGASDRAQKLLLDGILTGAAGDTNFLAGTYFANVIHTQTATESITTIAQVRIVEPDITNNLTGNITNTATLWITGAATEGTNNYGLWVNASDVRFDGQQFWNSINTETLSADKTIAVTDPMVHFLDPNGANRNVDLMPEISGQVVVIVNTADAGSEDLIVREDGGVTTIVTIAQDEMAFLVCNGTVWKGMVGLNT